MEKLIGRCVRSESSIHMRRHSKHSNTERQTDVAVKHANSVTLVGKLNSGSDVVSQDMETLMK